MAYTLEIYYNTGADNAYPYISTTYQKAQTFTTVGAFTLTRIKVSLCRNVRVTGAITASIHNTSSSLPSTLIASADATYEAGDLTTDTGGEWITFDFSSGVPLLASTMYALVLKKPTSGNVYWLCDQLSPTYTGGNYCYSNDSGTTWIANTARDFMFEVWSGSEGASYVDAAGSFTISPVFSGTAALGSYIDAAGNFTISPVFSGTAIEANTVRGCGGILNKTISRLVADGNNALYYEDQ